MLPAGFLVGGVLLTALSMLIGRKLHDTACSVRSRASSKAPTVSSSKPPRPPVTLIGSFEVRFADRTPSRLTLPGAASGRPARTTRSSRNQTIYTRFKGHG